MSEFMEALKTELAARLKAYKQLPRLQAALAVRKARATSSNAHLVQTTKAA